MKKKLLTLIVAVLVILGSIYGAVTGQLIQAPEPTTQETLSASQTVPTAVSTEAQGPSQAPDTTEENPEVLIVIGGQYDSMKDVALYIHLYGRLPDNYMTKSEARKLGWEGGSLERYAPGCCIGGDIFRNSEGLLPDAPGRKWTECDIDTLGQTSRGAKRIVFSNDGLIYYTEDHYETFELLYGEP